MKRVALAVPEAAVDRAVRPLPTVLLGRRGLLAVRQLLVALVALEVLVEALEQELPVCPEEVVLAVLVVAEAAEHMRAREPRVLLAFLAQGGMGVARGVHQLVERVRQVQEGAPRPLLTVQRASPHCFLVLAAGAARVARAEAEVAKPESVVPEGLEEVVVPVVTEAEFYLLKPLRFPIQERLVRMVPPGQAALAGLMDRGLRLGQTGALVAAARAALPEEEAPAAVFIF